MSLPTKDEEFENLNAGEPRILLALQGPYPAQWEKYDVRPYGKWGEKMVVTWKVFTSPDLSNYVTLYRYYNIKRDRAKRMIFGDGHDYRKDWIAANHGRIPAERKRLPLSIWKRCKYVVVVQTVTHDQKRSLPASSRWSKVGYVMRPVEEGESFERFPLEVSDF